MLQKEKEVYEIQSDCDFDYLYLCEHVFEADHVLSHTSHNSGKKLGESVRAGSLFPLLCLVCDNTWRNNNNNNNNNNNTNNHTNNN